MRETSFKERPCAGIIELRKPMSTQMLNRAPLDKNAEMRYTLGSICEKQQVLEE